MYSVFSYKSNHTLRCAWVLPHKTNKGLNQKNLQRSIQRSDAASDETAPTCAMEKVSNATQAAPTADP